MYAVNAAIAVVPYRVAVLCVDMHLQSIALDCLGMISRRSCRHAVPLYCLYCCQVFRCTLPRVGLDLNKYPKIKAIYNNCLKLPEFQKAMPQNQPDAPPEKFYTGTED